MFAVVVHAILVITYVALAVGLGSASYWLYEYSAAVSVCIGAMFANSCGLFHLALSPKGNKLSQTEKIRLDNQFAQLKEAQIEVDDRLQIMKETFLDEAQKREERLTNELKELSIGLAKYVALNEAKLKNSQSAPKIAMAPVRSERGLLNSVREAIESNRVELHLQPVVTLPQRRIAFYESFTRLRDATGGMIMPGEFLRVAEPSGLVSEIDNMLLLKCVQLARRMIKRDKRIAMFCNLSPTSLGDENFFVQFVDFLKQNRDLAGSMIFELPREAFDRLSMTAERNMGRLFDLGFRFSIDRCDAIDLDLRKLERMGVRYVKVAGDTLVRQLLREGVRPVTGLAREFEAQDVASLFARYGVDLIADRVENERTVVELLELDLGYAQGNLFGPPRPLHELQSIEDDIEAIGTRLAS
ncbi:MAG: cyclic-di-GMP phosphodiesterase flagellum assembly factor TipF [Hyphomonadaceae bacterium]|nr:MAG: cyclic-di-GMP phosphodiesterase flagellum assembly factor TipF [Hyphomonadaceae bacterium]KAF0186850.1 MAG: cyclic-di-GMP phosphodiesterase flagellum assembly factor TipF [Hyphomonadaceae bacterium]